MSEPQTNNTTPDPAQEHREHSPARDMRLNPDRPAVTRLSRKVLLAMGAVTALGIAGALFFALKPHAQEGASELYNTTNRSVPEGLLTLPRDYTGLPRNIPKLGPPLPGDLGKPMFNAGVTAPGMPTGTGTPEQQRLQQEQEAAQTSHLFATTDATPLNSLAATVSAPSTGTPEAPPSAASANATSSDHKLAFLSSPPDRQTQSPERDRSLPSGNVVQAGSVIPAALITGLRSDLPGEITAQVTANVYDSPTGKILLIPQGAKLIGQYDAQISFGQSRALLVWNRLIMPDGHSMVLERQPGTDTEGYAGLEDEVDNHWGSLFEAAVLSTVLSVGTAAGTNNGSSATSLAQALQQGASQSLNQTGEQVVSRSLSVQPTITIRPGFPVNVLVTHDLVLEPYQS
jgi:type IV secretion system protein VirB10